MKNNIYSFLEMIVNDNESFPFPVNDIRKELDHLLVSTKEFEYFIREAHRKLKYKYGIAYSQIFINVLDRVFSGLPQDFTIEEYMDKVLDFIETLESIKICRIEKDSPDGETLSVMQ